MPTTLTNAFENPVIEPTSSLGELLSQGRRPHSAHSSIYFALAVIGATLTRAIARSRRFGRSVVVLSRLTLKRRAGMVQRGQSRRDDRDFRGEPKGAVPWRFD